MPPNTIPLSQMMRELSTKPGFNEAFLNEIQGGKRKSGPALMTPDLVNHLRELIAGKNWDGLDHFPGWTMHEITPTVDAISHLAADKDDTQAQQQLTKWLDVGPYALKTSSPAIDFRTPAPPASFAADEPISSLGYGVTRGDGPGPLAVEHADSQRLADVLNRLSANGLDGVTKITATWDDERTPATPEELIRDILETGHTVTVTDSRYFANFGHLHLDGPNGDQDVMMPFFVNVQVVIPGTNRPLLVPVAHAEYEWHVRGPLLNADVSFYFGIDGKAEFRAMDSLDQAWVMKRDAHTYRQADAVEVTRLTGLTVQAYMRQHRAHPDLPFGGYYALGVCQDVVAAIELKMTGTTTLFPTTAEDKFFSGPDVDPRDAEINGLILRLPKDRDGKPPSMERIFGSLPVGDSDAELASVSVPGLGSDLVAVHDAWTDGKLKRIDARRTRRIRIEVAAIALGLALLVWLWWRNPYKPPPPPTH
jgi:hypothetical protein